MKNEKTFHEMKINALEQIVAHLVDPESYPASRISMEDCAVLMADDEKRIMSFAAFRKTEANALRKMRDNFVKFNIRSVSDFI